MTAIKISMTTAHYYQLYQTESCIDSVIKPIFVSTSGFFFTPKLVLYDKNLTFFKRTQFQMTMKSTENTNAYCVAHSANSAACRFTRECHPSPRDIFNSYDCYVIIIKRTRLCKK